MDNNRIDNQLPRSTTNKSIGSASQLGCLKGAATTLRNDKAHNSFFLASFADSTPSDVQSAAPGIWVWMAAVNTSSGVTSGNGEAYEDGGESLDYESVTQKLYSKVSASWTRVGNESLTLTVHPTVGGCKISKRKHVFQLRGLKCANAHMKCTARVKCKDCMKATVSTVAKADATLSSTAGAVVVTLSKFWRRARPRPARSRATNEFGEKALLLLGTVILSSETSLN